MRIGNREITPITLLHLGVAGAALLALIAFGMRSYSSVREAWCRDKILAAVTGTDNDAFTSGAAACDSLIAANPDRVAPRFYLGVIRCKEGAYAAAKASFEGAADCKSASPEEKSLALSAAASALALDGAKDGKPAHIDDALKLVERALAAKETPDALATAAILKSWRDGPESPGVEVALKGAMSLAPAPNAAALEQLYRLQGNALLRAKKSSDAAEAFGRVKAINPFNSQIGDASRNAQLTEIMDTTIEPAVRRAKIEKVANNINDFGKGKNDALLACAIAWRSFTGAPDYYAPEGPYTKAKTILTQLMSSDSVNPRAYRIYCGMCAQRVSELIKDLTVTVSGLNGETPLQDKWLEVPKSDDLTKDDIERLSKIRQFSNEEEITWQKFFDHIPDKKARVEAKSRQVMALRRQVWSTRAVETAFRDSLLDKASKAATELAQLDDSGYGHWQLALILVEKNQQGLAFNALQEARKRGFNSPDFTALYSRFRASSDVVDYGPAPGERQFGTAQLIRVTLQVSDAGALSDIKMDLDGHEVKKIVMSDQIFSLIDDKALTGDSHKIKISAQSADKQPVAFPEITLNVDKDPPAWLVTPPPAEDNKSQVWQIELKDASGLDWNKVSVGIRAVKVQSGFVGDMPLVKDGRYTRGVTSIKIKSGDVVRSSPFVIAPSNELPAGQYKIWIDASDIVGNRLKDEKPFTVK